MDVNIQRALSDKLYDKRKAGALELERVIRDAAADKSYDKVKRIIQQLCNDFAYAVHQPHARNGGLIGLAAAAIALGPDLARYLKEIVPPVLACFTDQDARVRYYACESMYNIAKVAKGEVLPYFNDIFDALCKLGADSELSVKNGAELLDRLIKDIVSESAATYVSVLHTGDISDDAAIAAERMPDDIPMAFSLPRFIPLLKERIFVINPFTRTFLVGWITLLDSIPDLELVSFLPEFLGGLFRFLSDANRDVHVATSAALERFLSEIKRVSRIKKGIAESRKSRSEGKRERSDSINSTDTGIGPHEDTDMSSVVASEEDIQSISSEDDWIPGQDVPINHKEILNILCQNLDGSQLEEDSIQETLRWIVEFLDICPEDVLPFTPKILAHLLPAMASGVESIRQAAGRVNTSLMDYVVSLSDDSPQYDGASSVATKPTAARVLEHSRRESVTNTRGSLSGAKESDAKRAVEVSTPEILSTRESSPERVDMLLPQVDLDYGAAVSSLTKLFLNDHEATRVAALTWLLMLHRKAPKKVLAFNDGTFPALLKTLSDPAETVVTRDLQLLSQISRHSDDDYFSSFMVNLLQLFSNDRKLLETRGNLIIRQLCVSLSAERIYRTLAACIEAEEDLEFASIMVQNLNNNLITAPELSELRKRLRNLETRDGQTFFVTLFRSWCYNAVATFSLCLLAQAYEQAYNLLQIFAELEMTVNMLIQIDKLVQLLESPVFTYLRLQLLEPERFPHLYKCLYGLLMLLPQSSAFAALKNRLNSVSAIGYLHIAPRPYVSRKPSIVEHITSLNNSSLHETQSNPALHTSLFTQSLVHVRSGSFDTLPYPALPPSPSQIHNIFTHRTNTSSSFSQAPPAANTSSAYAERTQRLKGKDDGIRWTELLEKFKSVQMETRKGSRISSYDDEYGSQGAWGDARITGAGFGLGSGSDVRGSNRPVATPAMGAAGGVGAVGRDVAPPAVPPKTDRVRMGIGAKFGRLGGGAVASTLSTRNKR